MASGEVSTNNGYGQGVTDVSSCCSWHLVGHPCVLDKLFAKFVIGVRLKTVRDDVAHLGGILGDDVVELRFIYVHTTCNRMF